MNSGTRNLIRKKVIIVDKQGELKTKRSPMHPAVLFTQQFGMIIAVWLAFIIYIAFYTGAFKLLFTGK